jgi:hypothetical protein
MFLKIEFLAIPLHAFRISTKSCWNVAGNCRNRMTRMGNKASNIVRISFPAAAGKEN